MGAAQMGIGGALMAKIGVMKALHRGVVREFKSDRHDTY